MRSLPVGLVLLAVTLALCGCKAPPEEQARAAIEAVGGEVRTDSTGQVISVDLSDSQADDAVLSIISIFPAVHTINCTNAKRITGSGLVTLGSLANLETLYLVNSSLNDAGLANVRRLRNLKTLHLGRTQITDAGLASLNPLASLQTLSLGNTGITDTGLVELRDLRKLSTIILRDTKVTPRGAQELGRMLPEARIVY